jgi:hypothetical protein
MRLPFRSRPPAAASARWRRGANGNLGWLAAMITGLLAGIAILTAGLVLGVPAMMAGGAVLTQLSPFAVWLAGWLVPWQAIQARWRRARKRDQPYRPEVSAQREPDGSRASHARSGLLRAAAVRPTMAVLAMRLATVRHHGGFRHRNRG